MKRSYKIIMLIFICICFLEINLHSQEVNLTATVDRNVVSINEPIVLTVTVSGNIAKVPKPELPNLDNFDIYSQGTSRNISFINGKVSSSISYNYSLIPQKIGKFTIGGSKIRLKGKTFASEPIEIEVTKESQQPKVTGQRPKGQNFTFPFEEKPRKAVKGRNDIFIKTYVDKKDVYVGEEVILTFKLHSNAHLLSQPKYIPPETKGFWKEDMGKEKQSRQVIKGVEYEVVEINYALFPLSSGKLTIGEAKLNCVIDKFFTDPFSFGFGGGTKKNLVSKPITVSVRPLPPAPVDFSGAVGNFDIYAKLDRNETKQGEPITVLTTITGYGNLRNVEKPEIKIPGFRVYESGQEVTTSLSKGRMREKKVFKTILIPNRSGNFEISGFSFVFFDPGKKEYQTRTVKNLNFKVLPGKGEEGSERVFGKGEIERLGEDIHFIKTLDRLKNEKSVFAELKYLLLTNGLLLCVFLFLFISQGVKERLKSKEDILKRRGALGNAFKLINKAKREAKRNNIEEAYELLHKAILQFFADKFNRSVWGTTEDDIKARLKDNGITEEKEKEVSSIFEACNRARYSREESEAGKFNSDLERTIKLLKQLRL